MTERELYTLTIPADSQTSVRTKAQRNTSKHGVLGGDAGVVESLSTAPGSRRLVGQFRGSYAELMIAELAELFEASSYEAVSYAGVGDSTPADGYYTPEALDARRLDPREGGVVAFDGSLTRVGTRDSHRRSVGTAVVQVENDFGNDQTAFVGIPDAASDVRLVNPETGATEQVSSSATRSAEFGDVAVYDVLAASFDDPTLVYDLPYAEAGKTDAKVWDDRGVSKFDADGVARWQRAFVTDHGFVGSPVLDNGLARLTFDRSAGLSVERWSDQQDQWNPVSLGDSDWSFDAIDVTRISGERVNAQCRFVNSGHDYSPFHLNMSLKRGWQNPQWTVPENETGPVPTGLMTLLDDIADDSDYSPQTEQGLMDRQEVRY